MPALRTPLLGGAVVLVLAAIAPAAAAEPEPTGSDDMSNGCPLAYIALNPGPNRDGTPRTYHPGAQVTASGVMKPGSGVAQVTMRWGSATGQVLGQAAVDAHDSWKGISFTVPDETPAGDVRLYLEAQDPGGAPIGRSTYVEKMHVAPVSPATRQPRPQHRSAPSPQHLERAGSGEQLHETSDQRQRARQRAPAVARSRSGQHTVARARDVRSEPTRSVARGRSVKPARTQPAVPAPAGSRRRDEGSSYAPRRSAPPVAPRPAPAVAPRSAPGDSAELPLLLLVGLGSALAVGAIAWRRRRRPPEGGAPGEAGEPSSDQLVEAELQQMIAEERAREADTLLRTRV